MSTCVQSGFKEYSEVNKKHISVIFSVKKPFLNAVDSLMKK